MPSTQEFRRRIKSVNNTKQITKAMEMISSIKMQKAVKAILANRSYTQNSWNLLSALAKITDNKKHLFLEKREVKRVCLIIAGSDRGLCGSFNADLLRKTLKYFREGNSFRHPERSEGSSPDLSERNSENASLDSSPTAQNDKKMDHLSPSDIDIIAVGKKTADIARKSGGNLVAEFPSFELGAEFWESRPVSKLALDGFLDKTYDQILVIYSHFESSIKQTPVVKQILPIEENHIDMPELWENGDDPTKTEYKFEPNTDEILEQIIPIFLRAQIYGAMLESNASEHSARMVAMKSATDNASSLIDELRLLYNTVRQDSITREIAEIAGAAEAMK
ncbi:MAG TPA: FoF1 ATP synthase subunit gamma [bacterium]|nr:FoF1 ATP synthase subunit gamma [bacterium]